MIDKIKQKLYEVYYKVKDFLLDFFAEEEIEKESKEESKSEYLVPLDSRTIRYLPKWAQEEIAAWRAKARALEEEIEELKEELNEYKKLAQVEELKEIARLKKALEEADLYNKYYVIFKTENDIIPKAWDGKTIITRLNIDGKETPVQLVKVVGMVLGDSDYGPTVQLLCKGITLGTHKTRLVKIDLGLLEHLPYNIYDFRNLLIHLKRGELILNVDTFGRKIPYALTVRMPQQSSEGSNEESNNSNQNTKYVILEEYRDVLNQYPDLRDAILDLHEKVNRLISENSELKAQIEEWKDKYSEVYAELTALRKHMEVNRAFALKAKSELGESYKALADTVGTNIQLGMRVQALETGYFDLMDRFEDLLRKHIQVKTMLPEEAGELVADKVADKLKEKIPLDILELGIRRAEEKKGKATKETTPNIEE